MNKTSSLDIKKLRNATGAGVLDCKKALLESNGDFQKAINILRKAGVAKANKKASREANEGLVATKKLNNKYCIIQLSCETDFVAKTKQFKEYLQSLCDKALASEFEGDLTKVFIDKEKENLSNLIATIVENMQIIKVLTWNSKSSFSYIHARGKIGVLVEAEINDSGLQKNLAMHIAAYSPLYLSRDSIPEEDIEREKEIAFEKTQGKPKDISLKIIEGKLTKWYKEVCLLEQEWILDEQKNVKTAINNAKVTRFIRLEIGK